MTRGTCLWPCGPADPAAVSTQRVPLYLSPEHQCSYLPRRRAVNAFVDPRIAMTPQRYEALLLNGFRRSGPYVYRPMCEHCSACRSARVPVAKFRMRRWQRRIWRRNADLAVVLRPPAFNPEHFALYQRYLLARHNDGEMDPHDRHAYMHFLTCAWMDTAFVEFRLHGRLAAVAAVDVLPASLSAVYTFFHPALHHRSLGTYAILWQIGEAERRGLTHVYLGYWVQDSPKMHYKINFAPIDILRDGRWQRVNAPDSGVERRLKSADN